MKPRILFVAGLFLGELACTSAQSTCAFSFPSGGDEGCNVPLCSCPAQPLVSCDSSLGTCILGACTGKCAVAPLGWAVCIGAPISVIVALLLVCFCCGCCCCARSGGGGGERQLAILQQQPQTQPFLGSAASYGNGSAPPQDWAQLQRQQPQQYQQYQQRPQQQPQQQYQQQRLYKLASAEEYGSC